MRLALRFCSGTVRWTCGMVLAVGLGVSHWLSAPAAPMVKAKPDPLRDLNQSFRAAYAKAKKEAIAKKGPVVFVESDHLVLLRDGQRADAPIIPKLYTLLKEVAHVPLTIFLLLPAEGELSEPQRTELRAFRAQMTVGRQALAEHSLDKETRERQEKIFAASEQFLDGVLARKKVKASEMNEFAGQMRPLLLANMAGAAKAELDALDRQMRTWRGEMTPEEWKQLRVLILGSALPRKDNLATQFFARLLGEKGEGPRIIYTESIYEEPRALDQLGRHLVDTDIGQSFFNDPRRMMRDLLGDAAAEYIKRMKLD